MAAKKNECLLCGSEYEVCKMCARVAKMTPWRLDYDTPRHFQIHAIIKEIREGILTNEEAKEKLTELGVTPEEVAGFVPSAQDTLRPIIGTKKPANVLFAPKASEPVVEERKEQPQVQQEVNKKNKSFKGHSKR